MLSITLPRATTRSFQPSLSRSTIPFDQPDIGLVRFASRLSWPRIAKQSLAFIDEQWECFVFDRGMPDVRQAIVVQVAEVGAHSRKRRPLVVVGHACLKAHLLKSLSSEIVKQEVRAVVVGHKHVEKSVAVVIRKHDSHSLAQHC